MKENDKILKAKEVLDRLNDNEEERERAYQRQRAIRYQNALIESGYDDGYDEGKNEEKIEIARKLYKKGMDIAEISDIVDLSVGELKNIIEK